MKYISHIHVNMNKEIRNLLFPPNDIRYIFPNLVKLGFKSA